MATAGTQGICNVDLGLWFSGPDLHNMDKLDIDFVRVCGKACDVLFYPLELVLWYHLRFTPIIRYQERSTNNCTRLNFLLLDAEWYIWSYMFVWLI